MLADSGQSSDEHVLLSYESNGSILGQFFNCGRATEPTKISEIVVAVDVFLYCVTCIFIGLCALYLKEPISRGEIWAIIITSIIVFIAAIFVMSLVTQPTSKVDLSFKVPMVPLIPALSILINIYLMLMLDTNTWIRFAFWMIIGTPIYYFSVRPYTEAQNSVQALTDEQDGKFDPINGFYNHFTNLGFQDDIGINGIEKNQPFHTFEPADKIENVQIQEELKKLDEMLEEVEEHILDNISECKLSVSVASNVIPCEENVVAVVHCCNASSPDFSTVPSPNNMNIEFEEIKIHAPIYKVSKTTLEDSELPLDVVPSIESQDSNLRSGSIESEETDNNINFEHKYNSDIAEGIDNQSVSFQETVATGNIEPVSATTPIRPLNNTLLNADTTRDSPAKPPLMRPTSENLMNVTLRRIKNIERSKSTPDVADDDNLKVGSERYKLFMDNLNAKLNRMTVVPIYYTSMNSKALPKPLERETLVNENVIIENINPKQAKEKLGLFINTLVENTYKNIHTDTNNDNIEHESQRNNKNVIKTENTNTHKDSTIEQDKDLSLESAKATDKDNSNQHYIAHKNRMQTVFRSINLKHLEPLNKSSVDERRNSKTICFMSDDKIKHKRAMTDIFKSIESRTKSSQKS